MPSLGHQSMPRLRVLALHSFRTNGAILRRQLHAFSNFGEALAAEDVDIHYLNGVHLCNPEDEEKMEAPIRTIFAGEQFYEWLNATPHPDDPRLRTYKYIDDSIKTICDYVNLYGPFDGVLGFSQGGSVCHLLSLLAANGQLTCAPPRFCILLSCRITRHAPHQPLVEAARAKPLELPCLVMYNGWDDHVSPEETEEVVTTLKAPVVMRMEHIKGHKIPSLTPEESGKVRAFLGAVPAARHSCGTALRLGVLDCIRQCSEAEADPQPAPSHRQQGRAHDGATGAGAPLL